MSTRRRLLHHALGVLACAGALAMGAIAAAHSRFGQLEAPHPVPSAALAAPPEALPVFRPHVEPPRITATTEDIARRESEPRDAMGSHLRDGLVITGSTPHRLLLFTFDDGPERRTTPTLLDHLDEAGVKAVFFLTANRIRGTNNRERAQAEIARDIVRRGHTVGSHTTDHLQLSLLDNEHVAEQVDGAAEILERVLGARSYLLRPPGGAHSMRVDGLLAERGYTTVLWNLGSGDFQVRTPEEVRDTWTRVLEVRERDAGERGGIILMHDTYEWSVAAFPLIMEEIRSRNCELLAQNEELYDVVSDLELFYVPRADAPPSEYASPAHPEPAVIEARQAVLREQTEQRCSAIAQR